MTMDHKLLTNHCTRLKSWRFLADEFQRYTYPRNMGRKSRKKREHRKKQTESPLPSYSWLEKDGIHTLTPGVTPTPEQLGEMTEEYQKQIRNSPLLEKKKLKNFSNNVVQS